MLADGAKRKTVGLAISELPQTIWVELDVVSPQRVLPRSRCEYKKVWTASQVRLLPFFARDRSSEL